MILIIKYILMTFQKEIRYQLLAQFFNLITLCYVSLATHVHIIAEYRSVKSHLSHKASYIIQATFLDIITLRRWYGRTILNKTNNGNVKPAALRNHPH